MKIDPLSAVALTLVLICIIAAAMDVEHDSTCRRVNGALAVAQIAGGAAVLKTSGVCP